MISVEKTPLVHYRDETQPIDCPFGHRVALSTRFSPQRPNQGA